uniref:Uncharacterized protein n=1 Tax=Brassica campestris TaxID=3711 RepID=A0A3P6B1V0_BRACM|nr:unnamed protein product [Brassica rapa]
MFLLFLFGMALLGCIHKQLTTLHGEQTNEKGEKMYIQTRMAEYAEELWELLEKKRQHLCLHVWSQGYGEGYR